MTGARLATAHPSRLVALLAFATLATGCAEHANETMIAGLGNCSRDSDCPAERACNLLVGRCLPLLTSVTALEVLPPLNDRGWVRQEFPTAEANDEGEIVLRLEEGARLSGRVYSANRPQTPLPAQVIATRPSLLQGQSPVRFETSATESTDDETPGYQLWVNPGYDYTLRVLPNPPIDRTVPCTAADCLEGYPTAVFSPIRIQQSEGRDLTLIGGDDSVTVTGRVVDAAGQPFDFSVQVRAIAEDGTQSTIGFTCSVLQQQYCSCTSSECRGDFSLRVPNEPKRYTLRIDPIRTDIAANDAAPRNVLIPSVECAGLTLGGAASAELEPIRLPPFARAATFQVRVVGVGDTDMPVASAQVTFRASDLPFTRVPERFSDCRATFQRSAITDADGRADLALLRGTSTNRLYRAIIVPPAKSVHATQVVEDYEIGPQGGTLAAFRLQLRPTVDGIVQDALGRPVPLTSIEAQQIPPADQDGELPLQQSAGETGSDGRFVLPIEPGVYNFRVRPPAGSGLPSFVVPVQRVASNTSELRLTAPEPALIVGRVSVSGAAAETAFTVQAYDLAPKTADSQVYYTVAREAAITNTSGQFRMLAPLP
jgi:hypothetical protein